MITKIELKGHQSELVATIVHTTEDRYCYLSDPDKIHGLKLERTAKGVWVKGRLLYIGDFKFFLSNKNINIIEE